MRAHVAAMQSLGSDVDPYEDADPQIAADAAAAGDTSTAPVG